MRACRSSARRWRALRAGHTNMDVPVSLGVLLVTAISLWQTLQGGRHTYFDSAVTLLFFLLIGRVLDHRARGQARATAQQLLTLRATEVAVLRPDGSVRAAPQESVAPGARVLVGMGERIGVDGVVERGSAPLDASLVTGESLPVAAGPGTQVFAGTLNLGEPVAGARHRHRRRHLAGRMRAADRGGRGAARPFRHPGRPGGAPLCAGGAPLRRRHLRLVVAGVSACRRWTRR